MNDTVIFLFVENLRTKLVHVQSTNQSEKIMNILKDNLWFTP